jgi:hypothetical protein
MIHSRTLIPMCCLLAAATIASAQTPAPAAKVYRAAPPARSAFARTPLAAPAPPVPPAWDQTPEPAAAPYPPPAPPAFAATPAPAAPPAPPAPLGWDQTPEPAAAPYPPPAPPAYATPPAPAAPPAPPAPLEWDQTPEPAAAPYPPMTPRAFAPTPRPTPAPRAAQAASPTPRPMPAPRALPMDQADIDRLREMADEARANALGQIDSDQMREIAEEAREKARAAVQLDREQIREMAEQAREQSREIEQQAREQAREASRLDAGRLRELALEARDKAMAGSQMEPERLRELTEAAKAQAFAAQDSYRVVRPFVYDGPAANGLLAQAGKSFQIRSGQSDDSLYNAGQRALNDHKYDEALAYFNQAVARAGARADSALFYKAYTLNKLGQSKEALAAIAELRKTYANSRWLDDAKALELDVNQRAGRPVAPEAESDEELKLIAINSIMQSDPERAIPLLENILKSSQPPKVKERALFVLAQSSAPRAQQVIEQIARGGANPDLQLKAINYLSQRRRQGINPNLLPEIYGSTNDVNVKRAILDAYEQSRDKDRLAQIAKTEKTPELRTRAFQKLSNNNPGQPELWAVYQAETSPETRQELLKCMYNDGNSEKLAEVVRTEKDPKTRRVAIEVLASQRAAGTGDLLVSVYNSEQDPQNKQMIVDRLSNSRSAKYLVDLARNEKDPKLKVRIVDRLSNMHSKEASDYLMELLSK